MSKRASLGLYLVGLHLAFATGACSVGDSDDCIPGKRGCDCIAFECLGPELQCINDICQLVADETVGEDEELGDGDDEPGDGDSGDGDGDSGDGDGDSGDGDGEPGDDGRPDDGDGDGEPGDGDGEPGDGDGDLGPLAAAELLPGDLVITELTWDPIACVNDACEWFEVYNASGAAVELMGLGARDSQLGNEGVVQQSKVLEPGEYAVVAKGSPATWPFAVEAVFHDGGFSLNNSGSDKLVIFNMLGIIDETTPYTSESSSDDGVSWRLDPALLDAEANDAPASWCFSPFVFELGEYGSPGEANDAGCQ